MSEKTAELDLIHSSLGQPTTYSTQYNPELLFRIPRKNKRAEIGISEKLPFHGIDVWNAYELSWLNNQGKPLVALVSISVPCESPNIFESKSLKLYLNSFTQTHFENKHKISDVIRRDLSNATGSEVIIDINLPEELPKLAVQSYSSFRLDSLEISTTCYDYDPSFLSIEHDGIVTESIHSNLLKSNCLITGQPDWGSIEITYKGKKIQLENLLRYIISYRNHHEFHEQCVERIFMDILNRCQPKKLSVEARYTRRGGIDINPFRSTEIHLTPPNRRLFRQ